MKLETYKGLGTKVVMTVTRNEAFLLLSTLAGQLSGEKSPQNEIKIGMEKGGFLSLVIDFNKEQTP